VSVTRFWKAGNVDYKKVVELKGIDLEAYRGTAREEVRLSVGGQLPSRLELDPLHRDSSLNRLVSLPVSRAAMSRSVLNA
jgi:hypothetical protein